MAISRMQQPRQLLENGGILTLEDAKRMAPPGESLAYINPAEAKLLKSIGGAGEDVNGTGIKSYFFKKVFRKAKRAVKKVAKSKIGKAALTAAALYYAPAMFGGTTGFGAGSTYGKFLGGIKGGIGSFFGPDRLAFNAMRTSGGQPGFFSNILGKTGAFIRNNPGKSALLGLGAAGIAAPFLMGGGEQEEVDEGPSFTQTPDSIADIVQQARNRDPSLRFLPQPQFVRNFYAADGGIARIPMQEGGMMDMGGLEKDYREGGFVPIGEEERADDVPARLSKNEFVFTADAVRAAGGGDVDRGADKMYKTMKQLESRVA